jgi:hypothetical protein
MLEIRFPRVEDYRIERRFPIRNLRAERGLDSELLGQSRWRILAVHATGQTKVLEPDVLGSSRVCMMVGRARGKGPGNILMSLTRHYNVRVKQLGMLARSNEEGQDESCPCKGRI